MLKLFRKFQEKTRYLFDQIFAHKFFGQFLLLMSLSIIVILTGATAMLFGLFSEENANISSIPRDIDAGILDSLWWSLHQVIRLHGLEKAYGASTPVLIYSLFLSAMGLIVFSSLISLINNAMRSHIEKLRKGDTPVCESNHVLLLGWNNKVFVILRQLARLQPGIKVVILAPMSIDTMQEQFRIAGFRHVPIKLILRSGIPSNHGELNRVAISQTSSVIVLTTDEDDSEAIKTILLLSSYQQWQSEPPVLMSSITMECNYELAKIAARNKVHVISSGRTISRVIVQTIRNPGLADIYSEIFSTTGNSLHVQSIPDCANHSLAEIAYNFPDAIPIGIAWHEKRDGEIRHAAGLNPEPDYELAEDEQLILLTHHLQANYVRSEKFPRSQIYHEGVTTPLTPTKILLIGCSDILLDILQELDSHATQMIEITILWNIDEDEIAQQLPDTQVSSLNNLTLAFLFGDAAMPTAYANIELATFQSIVVLAEKAEEERDVDTHTLRTLLQLFDLRKNDSSQAHTVVELLDESNHILLADLGVDDIIISTNVISAQLAQIALNKVLAPIYHELLSAGGVEISLRPASDYVILGSDCHFSDLIYSCQQKMEIALGLRLAHQGGEVLLNPSRDACWSLTKDDQIIVLAQQVYR